MGNGGTREGGNSVATDPLSIVNCQLSITYRHPKLSRVEMPVTGLMPDARLHISFI